MAFFELRGVTKNFGGLVAVNDLSFAIEAGQHHCDDWAKRRRQIDRV